MPGEDNVLAIDKNRAGEPNVLMAAGDLPDLLLNGSGHCGAEAANAARGCFR